MKLVIGSHVSFTSSKQLLGSLNEALSYNANTFMLYTGSTQSTKRGVIDEKITLKAHELMKENGIDPKNVIVHAPYIINFANRSDEDKYNFYINFFTEELNRCNSLGLDKIVLHPGSATTCTKEEGIKNIAYALNKVFKNTPYTNVLLEFMAGKGNEIGSSIDELKAIIDLIEDKSRIYVCLDTCHMNDAGIDLNYFDEFLNEFDKKIGINKIKCIHINDSKNVVGAHKDRHDNIGYGTISFDTLLNIIYNERIDCPRILETPYINRGEKDATSPYKQEIEMIRNKKFIDFIQ